MLLYKSSKIIRKIGWYLTAFSYPVILNSGLGIWTPDAMTMLSFWGRQRPVFLLWYSESKGWLDLKKAIDEPSEMIHTGHNSHIYWASLLRLNGRRFRWSRDSSLLTKQKSNTYIVFAGCGLDHICWYGFFDWQINRFSCLGESAQKRWELLARSKQAGITDII